MRSTAQLLRGLVWFCAAAAFWQGGFCAPATADTNQVFRLAFSSSMFTEVNESDARAAMKVWIMTVAKERGIPVDPEPRAFRSVEEMAAACQTNPVDGFFVITEEFARLQKLMKFDRLGVASVNGKITEEYLLLVRKDSGVERLDQLQGHTLNILNTPRTSLATVWLDTLLLEQHLKRTSGFFGRVTLANKASRVALPVFFRQADACVVTRNSFAVMGELNPQLNTQLKILAVSPPVVPASFAFLANGASPHRQQILTEMSRLGENPAGQQILTLVQAEHIEDQPVSCLDSALELLARHERLCAGENNSNTAQNTGNAPSSRPGANP